MSILHKLRKNTTIKESDILEDSKFFNEKDVISTNYPAINVILSGRLDGGFTPGLTMFAGPSKHFKTAFSLILAKAYQDKYPDAAILFYDSEFGSPASYFKMFGIDTSRVIHTPIADIEQLKFDIVNQLKEITRGDKVMIVIDSIGNLASKKEIDDALEQKSTADMTRAKQIKSLFRMVTPHLTLKDIPMAVINHTYKEMSLFPKDVVSGGCLVADTLIQTTEGLKEVQNITTNDKVYTLIGEKEVTAVWDPFTLEEGEPECFEVEFEDGYKVICSNNHQFLIDGLWVEAKDLSQGMNCQEI